MTPSSQPVRLLAGLALAAALLVPGAASAGGAAMRECDMPAAHRPASAVIQEFGDCCAGASFSNPACDEPGLCVAASLRAQSALAAGAVTVAVPVSSHRAAMRDSRYDPPPDPGRLVSRAGLSILFCRLLT